MSSLIRLYPGDRSLDLVLVVTVVVALASSAGWLISRRLAGNAALRHFVLLSALICCLASPAAAWFCAAAGLTLVSIPILGTERARIASGVTRMEIDPERTPPRPSTNPPPIATDLPSPHPSTTTDTNAKGGAARAAVPGPDRFMEPELDVQGRDGPAAIDLSIRGIATGAIFVWVAGTLFMLGRLARNSARVVWLRHSSTPLQDDRLETLLRKVNRQLGARNEPLLLGSGRAIAPLAVAFGRPAVILPERLLGAIGDNELTDILVHEVAHVQRGDQWLVLVQELAGALYWPIVSVHGLNRELRRACEEVCDNVVLAGRDAISYGETLLHVAELLVEARKLAAAAGIISGQGELERRIAGLIDPRRNTTTTTGRAAACVAMLLFIAGGAVASATRFAPMAVAADGPRSIVMPAVLTTVRGGTELPAAQQNQKALPVAYSKRTILLQGKVLGPGDRAVAGARLYLSVDEWTDPVELGITDASGSYHLDVPEEKLRRTVSPNFVYDGCIAALIATAGGFGPGWAELPAAKGGRMGEMKPGYAQNIHLVADIPIAGRVIDAGGKPIAGAAVAVYRMIELADPHWRPMRTAIKAGNPNLMSPEQSDPNNWFAPLYPTAWKMIPPAVTDSQGRFQITGVGGDRVIRLNVSGPGIWSASVCVLTRDDVADFTQAIRNRYPRARRPDGHFYPPRKEAPEGNQGVQLFGPSPTIEVDPGRTVAGVVRDARTGEPIAHHQVGICSVAGYGAAETDSHGRYRLLRGDDDSSIVIQADKHQSDRYLTVMRRLTGTKGFGEIIADLDIPPGVVINGRVLEAGTDRPIVSAPRRGCHDTVPGPLLAGSVFYFPLSSNTALRGAPTGLYFEGIPRGSANWYRVVPIGGDGQFRMAVPPGPGVLLVQASPAMPMFADEKRVWNESEGFHHLFPYVNLATRAKGDGAPEGDTKSLPGFTGPIPLSAYHAYRVINPAADATTLDLTIFVPRAPSRTLRFVGPNGRAIRGVTVTGLLAPPRSMAVVLGGSEAEVLALEPGELRDVTVISNDGAYAESFSASTGDPQPRTIRLKPAGSGVGRVSVPLLDARIPP